MAGNKPLVTVITPTFNRANLIPLAIMSIVKQTYGNIEHIIVNDGGESLEEGLNQLKEAFPEEASRIRYIEKEENTGVSDTRNKALAEATGDYICLLDDDDIYLPLAIEFRLWAMKKYKTDVVYTRALRDVWGINDDGYYYSQKKELYWDSPFHKDRILVSNVAHSPCVMFSRKAWDKSGNYVYDTSLETGEDYDFWIALSRNSDFTDLRIIDAESTIRPGDPTQATGNKNFAISYPIIYKKWRSTAIDLEGVTEHQNQILKQLNLNPEDYGL